MLSNVSVSTADGVSSPSSGQVVATGDGHPIVLVFTVVAGLILWRNYRRFRQRVRAALAEYAAD